MRKFSSYLGVLVLICFSFYYTDRAVDIVKRNDPLRQTILEVSREYEIEPVSATILEEEIIPGLNGKRVNIDKSYKQMKRYNEFHESLLVFDEILPETNLVKNYDKFIVKGNGTRQEVALLFLVESMTNLETLYQKLLDKDAVGTFFIDGTVIENEMDFINDLSEDGNQIENLGYDGVYSTEKLSWTNNMINSITNSSTKYCYVDYNNYQVLDLCKKEKMYTVKPTSIAVNYPFSTVKNSLTNGNIIAFPLTERTVKELPAILSYIEQKGYKTVTLSEVLSESRIVEK